MHYTTTILPKSETEIRVSVDPEEMRKFFEHALKNAARETELDGFRKGKAPPELVKAKIGEFPLWKQASFLAIETTYPKILKEIQEKQNEQIEPISSPSVEIEKCAAGEPMEYKARFSFLPVFALPDYAAIAKKTLSQQKEQRVEEKDIHAALQWFRESRAKIVRVARPAQPNDQVTIDFEARHNGKLLTGGASKNHLCIIGDGKFLPGFEEALVGASENETRRFSLAAPANYPGKEPAGKKIDFSVTVKMVAERILPEWNDAFAQSVGAFQTLNALKESIANGLLLEKKQKEQKRIRIAMADAIANATAMEIPDILIERECAKMIDELRSEIERTGMQWNDYLSHIKKTEDELRAAWISDAERRVKIALTLRKIARAETLQPSEQEIQEATNQTVARLGMDEAQFKKIDPVRSRVRGRARTASHALDPQAFLEYNTTVARNEKVFAFLENVA